MTRLSRYKLQYIGSVLLYGTIGMIVRQISFPSDFIVLCRGLIGGLFILSFRLLSGHRPEKKAIQKNTKWLILSGACLGFNWIFLFAAYVHTTVAIASLFNYMAPILLVLLSPLLFKEKLTAKKLLCVGAALLGVLLISGVLTGRSQALHPIGMAYAALAAIGFSALVVCNRRMSPDLSPYDRSFVQLFISALIVLPYVLLMNRGIQLSWDLRSVLLTLLIGILQTGVAYIWYFGSIPEIPTQTFAVLGYLEPTMSVLCSALILREPMGLTGWIGALLIIGAAVVNELI
ncbi:MAG: EamA family transporter [Firmicutes bacterium]|nr:EamA family transporter [Bacillota bacterium]